MPCEPGQQLDPQAVEALLEVTRLLAVPTELDAMLSAVIDAARRVLHADRGTVFLYDRASDELYVKVATELSGVRFPAGTGIAGQCAQTRRVINVPDCYADPRFNREIDRKTGYRTRCLLAVPLVGFEDELVGVMQVLNKDDGVFDDHDSRIALALGAQCAVALQRARLIEAHLLKKKMEHDLELARGIQQNVLPKKMPTVFGYDMAGWNRPAEQTGGDIFDAVALGGPRVLLLMCDATGHGVGPAISVTQVRAMVRMAVRLGTALDDIFIHVNDQLAADLADNRFVTAFIGVLDPAAHRIDYHSGGQAPLLHFSASDGGCESLDATTVPMGIMPGLALDPVPPICLAPGDIFALISDGIFEALNPLNEQFGVARTLDVIRRNQHQTMDGLIQAIAAEVDGFVAGQPQGDDMTIVLVKRLG